jgi:hypothetical protein
MRLDRTLGGGPDESGIAALAMAQALLGMPAQSVAAQRADEATFLTVRYRGGTLLQLTLASLETPVLEVVTRECSLKLEGDRLYLKRRGPEGVAGSRLLSVGRQDHVAQEAAAFASALAGGTFEGNLETWIAAAQVWRAARQSLVEGGPVWLEPPEATEIRAKVPTSILEGGARRSSRRLALVS